MDEPNAVWTADFKGELKTRDGEYCDDQLWDVCFGSFWLGRLDERRMRIEDQPGRWRRGTGSLEVSPMSPD